MRVLIPVGFPLAALIIIAACSKDNGARANNEDAGASNNNTGDGSVGPPVPTVDGGRPIDPPADAGRDFPTAVGDPCRGLALPSDRHFVATGLCLRVVASKIYAPRQMTFAPNGDLWIATSDGYVKLLRDANANGIYEPEEIHDWASIPFTGIFNGNNIHLDVDATTGKGFVYAGVAAGVVRWPYDAKSLIAPSPPEPVVINEPSDGHPLHTVHVFDGYLYVMSGSQSDASNPMAPAYDSARSLLRRWPIASFKPGTPWDWSNPSVGGGENVTVGLRNMVGFTRNAAGRMYGVVNGLDLVYHGGVDLHEDNPGEQILELKMGAEYGFPFCFTSQRAVMGGGLLVPPGTQLAYDSWASVHDDAWCAAHSMKPATFVQAHSAPLEILFFDNQAKGVLPERWRGGAFVSLHGSHARTKATGYKVVWVPFDAAGNSVMPTSTMTDTTFPYETVLGGGDTSGPKDGPWSWSVAIPPAGALGDNPRPVGLAIHPTDGALYISSDTGSGPIYRVGLGKN